MFGNIGQMMKLYSDMKKKLPEMRAKLAAAEYTGEAGGGKVQAVINGKMQLVSLRIAPELLAPTPQAAGAVEGLVKAAIDAAQEKGNAAAAAAMKELTGGVDLSGLDSMMG